MITRESEKNGILEKLASNQSLGTVLDSIARLICGDIQGIHCAILLQRADRWHVGAAPGCPKEWLAAVRPAHSVPFEAWTKPSSFHSPERDPEWRVFGAHLTGAWPAAIRSYPIGGSDLSLGVILLFGNRQIPDINADVMLYATYTARIAIEYRQLYDDLQFQAQHDSLTGVPNRTLFEYRLNQACNEAKNLERRLGVLSVDLDHIKEINDSLGHGAGDILLCEIAGRIRRVIRPGDTVARSGGDEFSVLIPDIRSTAEVAEIAERILAAVRQPLQIDGRALITSASIGFAVYPEDSIEADALQRNADAALYCAKELGRDRVQSFGTRNAKLDRVRMDQVLRGALRDGQFAVHYQPKVGVDGNLCGLEALLRLDHPVHGRVSPAEFIPAAEASGIIVPLGAWVLDEVCRQIALWRSHDLPGICVAVNVSSMQLSRPEYAKEVLECLGRHGVSPWSIELELTESILMSGGEHSQRQMQELRALGIRFSIDDFGTGYSSLSYLYRLQVDAIKLDRSFVQCVDTDPAARRLVQAMIGVAESLGLGLIAEGVETEAQRATLVTDGCTTMQGFLFARPQSAGDLEAYLQSARSKLDASLLSLERSILHPV